jgi:N-acyl-D-aspartate/D-glutamate deacylase
MLDVLIRDGLVVDGSGAPGRRADVGIRGGRIVEVGAVSESASESIDAAGLVVAPGFIDPHTHYDAQLFWDPFAAPSNEHGVTTVIGGNCGFTVAPLSGKADDADYIKRMLAVVEGMPLEALENGLDFRWRSFSEYLDRFEGRIGVNAGFLVGHCALRRSVMGAAATEAQASPAQVEAMARMLGESLAAGGLGLSASRSFTHDDGDGKPVPSRVATPEELLALCREVSRHPGTSLEFITDGCLRGFSATEIDYMAELSLAAQRPLNWNVLTIDAKEPERYAQQLAAGSAAAKRGARVVALTMPVLVRIALSFLTYGPLMRLPGWGEILSLPLPERMQRLRDPETRRRMQENARKPEAGVFARLANFSRFEIGETFSDANRGLTGRQVGDIARERGASPFDTLVDIVLADQLETVLWPVMPDDDSRSWEMRTQAWADPHVLIGGSDAGAHLDRMCGAPYPTAFLADCLRGRKLVSLERAVELMTRAPAELFGLVDRGLLRAGAHADVVLFDPERVGNGPVHFENDLPGGSKRMTADAVGVERVLVNGRAIIARGRATGELPGTVLRAGRDTRTASLSVPAAR